jgi:tRNA-dihydrouridine synthase 1
MVQLAGNDVEMVVKAAHIVLEHAPHITGIDLNLGCPQGIARKGRYGAFLMEQEEALVYQILTSLRQSLPKDVLVSAKIRLPLDPTRLKSRITRLAETGIDTLTIHGRTLKENKTLVGPCHVDQVRRAIQVIASTKSLPVVANGGIENYHSISTVLQQTGASAVMSSEALLETPNLFSVAPLETPRELLQQQLNFSRRYVELCAQHPPLPGVLGHDGGSFNIVRGHLFKFLHRYLQIHMDLRDRLADPKLRTLMQASELLEELDERYSSTAALEQCPSSRPESSWYRRHWTESPREEEVDLSVEDRKRRLQERIERLRSLKHQQRLVA